MPALRTAFSCLLAFALCCVALRAGAQAEAAPPPEYHDLIERALVESSASRWPEALALFRQAHAAYPNARTHRGIGMVAYEVRDYAEAQRHLSQALSDPRRPLDAAQRAEVSTLLERTQAFVGQYDLRALPADAAISVDGKRVTREADGTLVLALGSHHIEVQASAPERRGALDLQVKGGERQPLTIVLEAVVDPSSAGAATAPPAGAVPQPAPSAPAPTPAETARAASLPPAPEHASESSSTLPIVLTAAGGVLLVAGAVLVVVGLGDIGTVEDSEQNTAWSKLKKANARAPVMTGLGFGLLGAGGALAIGGGVAWAASGEDADADGELDAVSLRLHACF